MSEKHAISFRCLITKIETCADRSFRVKLSTPELLPDEAAQLFRFANNECQALFSDQEAAQKDLTPFVNKGLPSKSKTPSQRLRNTIFVYSQATGVKREDFESFYDQQMEKIINWYKARLDELEG